MRKIRIIADVEVYESMDHLPEEDKRLLLSAKESLSQSYAPYSKFHVGAAALIENGEIVGGGNQENAAYSMCLCAERTALAAATSRFPNQSILALAITVQNEGKVLNQPVSPCGACRQVICEVESQGDHKIRVIIQGEMGPVYIFQSAQDLLPLAFDGKML